MSESHFNTLFQVGRLFDGHRFHEDCDLRMSSEGKVLELGSNLAILEGDVVIEARDKWLLPGLVDCHVHFREPGLVRKEGYAMGSLGALHGGVTTVCEIQNNPPLMSSAELLQEKMNSLRGVSRVDYAPYGSLIAPAISRLSGFRSLVPAVKCFLGGSTGAAGVKGEDELRELFSAAAQADLMVVAHCEDNAIMKARKESAIGSQAERHDWMRPVEAEVESIRAAIRMAHECGTRLHVFHVSTAAGAALIAEAKQRGQHVSGSMGPQYLLVEAEEAHQAPQNRFKINPSIKSAHNREGLREALRSGDLAIIGTDHAPHPLKDKDRPYAKAASGFPSIDLLLPLLFAIHDEADISLELLLRAVTSNPATEFGLSNKGVLAPNMDADLVLLDPTAQRSVDESQLPSRSKWSPFQAKVLRAWPEKVWLRGELAFADGHAVGDPRGKPLFL